MRKCCGPYMWTPAQAGIDKGRGFYQSSNSLSCGDSTFDLRLELANDHLQGRVSHIRGYYADSFQDQTVIPIVARLPHGRGFLAGYTYGPGMCAAIDFDIWDNIEDCARDAHRIAEMQAEADCEANARAEAELDEQLAAQDTEDNTEE